MTRRTGILALVGIVLGAPIGAPASRLAFGEGGPRAPVRICSARDLVTARPQRPGAPVAAGATQYVWNTRDLAVQFLEGSTALRRRVLSTANQWSQACAIQFHVTTGTGQIRIGFDGKPNYSSFVGPAPEGVPPTEPTMMLGDLSETTDEETFRSTVLHEFGHAIGLVHEHQSPNGGIRWDRERVLADCLRDQGWDAETVENNIFAREFVLKATPFDPNSIMLYSFPPEWTLDGRGTRTNTRLSAQDRAFVREIYGAPGSTVAGGGGYSVVALRNELKVRIRYDIFATRWNRDRYLAPGESARWYAPSGLRFRVVFDGSFAPGLQSRVRDVEGAFVAGSEPSVTAAARHHLFHFVEVFGGWDLLGETSMVPSAR